MDKNNSTLKLFQHCVNGAVLSEKFQTLTFQGLVDVTLHVLYSTGVIESVPTLLSRHTIPSYVDRYFSNIQVFCGNVV